MNEDTVILTPAEENAQRAERLGRVLASEKAEADVQAARVEKSVADGAKVNETYFEKQRQLEDQINNNKPIVLKPRTNDEAVAAEAARYPRPAVNPMPLGDPLMDRETDASKRASGYVTPKLKKSITLQSAPDPFPTSDPRRGMSKELILSMGMNPDPKQPAFKK